MVRVTLKNLQQKAFVIEIDITCTVKELKDKVEADKGKEDYPSGGQKLIYAGKILQDDQTLSSYDISESKFIVIMVTKPKTLSTTEASKPSTPATEQSSSATTDVAASAPTPAPTPPATATPPAATDTAATGGGDATAEGGNAESLLVMGDDFEKMVMNIMEMGYEKPDVEAALRASFNNPYTAVQYLVDGLPDTPLSFGAEQTDEQLADALAAAAQDATQGSATTEGGDGSSNPLAFLRNQPNFEQMCSMMRNNPELLDSFLQQIRTTNPGLLQAITDNQQDFIRMINAPDAAGAARGEPEGGNTGSTAGSTPGDGPRAASGEAGADGRRSHTIMISQQDRDTIDRLKALGNFHEDMVVQAYFACDKNENQAAEFLFSQAWEDDR